MPLEGTSLEARHRSVTEPQRDGGPLAVVGILSFVTIFFRTIQIFRTLHIFTFSSLAKADPLRRRE